MKKWLLIFVHLICIAAYADDSISFPGHVMVHGYIKDMQVLSFNKDFKNAISSGLIHNRINLKWKPVSNITIVTELRNRVFWGEEVRLTPGFASLLRNTNEKFDLQKAWISDSSFIVHTNVERLYFNYGNDKLDIRIGRQRINWGITTTWNPNDIFNTYNFLDFDYEERPGSDGGRISYRFNNIVSIEAAYANTGIKNGNIAAAKLSLNKWNYDMQFISGLYREYVTLGCGWAGSIKDAGFKGEIQYLYKNADGTDHLNMTMEGDYMFKNEWYVNVAALFNNSGINTPIANWNVADLRISPEELMPTKWNTMISATKQITPLFSATTGILYAPGTNLLIFLPSLQYSMMENLDINLFWQSFFLETSNQFENVNHRCFLRIRWSY